MAGCRRKDLGSDDRTHSSKRASLDCQAEDVVEVFLTRFET